MANESFKLCANAALLAFIIGPLVINGIRSFLFDWTSLNGKRPRGIQMLYRLLILELGHHVGKFAGLIISVGYETGFGFYPNYKRL